MEKYNQKWVYILCLGTCLNYAVTLGKTIYYTTSKDYVDKHPWWRAHEQVHLKQYEREGTARFLLKYVWYSLRHGYTNNPYEVEARMEVAKRWVF